MDKPSNIAIFSLTENGYAIAGKLGTIFPDAVLHHQPMPFAKVAQDAFNSGAHCLFVCAAGIVFRSLAPVINDKFSDPAVIVLDEQGQYVIPLLSSHEGGGGALAKSIADHLGAQCVNTTATDYGHPIYALGVGCARGCPADEMLTLVKKAIAVMNEAPVFSAIASINIKEDEPGILEVAEASDLELVTYSAERLRAVEDQLSEKSEIVFREVGCYGVAEAAALIAASEISGSPAELVVTKLKNTRATVAIARSYLQGEQHP